MDMPTLEQTEAERMAIGNLDAARPALIRAMRHLDATVTRDAFLAVSMAVAAVDDACDSLRGES